MIAESRAFRDRLSNRAVEVGIPPLRADTLEKLCSYFELLRAWNRRLALTSLPVEEYGDEAMDRVLLEPLAAAGVLAPAGSLIDVGSGGGSPAVPLKIVRPEMSLVMVDAKEKKCAFLREVVRGLQLSDASVRVARYQALTSEAAFAGRAEAVTVRAVRTRTEDLALMVEFLKPLGRLLLFSSDPHLSAKLPKALEHVATDILLPERKSFLHVLRRRAV